MSELERVLVVNAGSSSCKLRVLDPAGTVVDTVDLPVAFGYPDPGSLRRALDEIGPVDAVGHRIVHGGTSFPHAVHIDERVVARIEALADLAPLHQPAALVAMGIARERQPAVPHVACFDTAFHATLLPEAATYALPPAWRLRWDLRRYGFHGLSHAYVARRVAELDGRPAAALRIVSCHLGAGASLAAIAGGRSIDTTMGFTPLAGLVMATRPGDVDPGLLLWLQVHAGMSAAELADGLAHRSGLLGLAETADMAELLADAGDGDPRARFALAVYLHRLRAGIAAMAAAMGGLDAIAFTGGVAEHAPQIRQLAADRLGFLGVAIDPERNTGDTGDREISPAAAPVRAYLVASREDQEIACQVRELLAGQPPGSPRGLPLAPEGQRRHD